MNGTTRGEVRQLGARRLRRGNTLPARVGRASQSPSRRKWPVAGGRWPVKESGVPDGADRELRLRRERASLKGGAPGDGRSILPQRSPRSQRRDGAAKTTDRRVLAADCADFADSSGTTCRARGTGREARGCGRGAGVALLEAVAHGGEATSARFRFGGPSGGARRMGRGGRAHVEGLARGRGREAGSFALTGGEGSDLRFEIRNLKGGHGLPTYSGRCASRSDPGAPGFASLNRG